LTIATAVIIDIIYNFLNSKEARIEIRISRKEHCYVLFEFKPDGKTLKTTLF